MARKSRDDVRLALVNYGRGANARRWTEEEDKWLVENYEALSAGELAGHLKRTVRAIYARAFKLGLRNQEPDWTVEELKAAFKDPQDPALKANRTMGAIYRARYRYRPVANE